MLRPRYIFRPYSFVGSGIRRKSSELPPLQLTRRQSQEVDRRAIEEWGMHSLVLMENAGRGAADVLTDERVEGLVVLLCGKGNNGGDGFVIARHLLLRGIQVKLALAADPAELRGEAQANFEILQHCDCPVHVIAPERAFTETTELLSGAEWAVDALLGTGAAGPPRSPYDQIIHASNEAPVRRFAVDVPSGVDAETGEHAGVAFLADHTCTFVAPKRGLLDHRARGHVGKLHVADIGVPLSLAEQIVTEGEK